MLKRIYMIFVIIITIMSINILFCGKVSADSFSWQKDISGPANKFIQNGEKAGKIVEGSIKEIFAPIAATLATIGNILLVIAITIFGIQYIISTPDKKGKLKVKLIGLVVCAVIVYGGQILWSVLYNILENISATI